MRGFSADPQNPGDFVDEGETLPPRLLLTIGRRKVFLTAIFKSSGRAAAYPPAHRGRKRPEKKTGNRLSRKTRAK
ncbi:hypothetical protein SS05631_c05740 [Sinorhizobium sp. CCBAU 05631]|uniref:Uncharacterized protein n=1 Tax=Rhizobium fredii TaxID=380 RepID=A0A2L0H1W7_RHIFR|nr:hypothetical protein SS05631_c05740 [Sinorhizobium sp. CCBAU 05631]AUX75471.1 hypothetical protein NXT3_CH00874 [Sinorhizobium fredii]